MDSGRSESGPYAMRGSRRYELSMNLGALNNPNTPITLK